MDEKLADRFPVEHSVESCNLIYSHRGHLQDARHFIHHTNTAITVLSLTQIKQRQYGGFLVLRRVTLEDFIDQRKILLVELERDGRIVIGFVPVLDEEKISHGPRLDLSQGAIAE